MTPAEIGAKLSAALGATVTESAGGPFARTTADVPAERWVAAVQLARDELSCDFFDWLSAVDELDEGFSVVTHLWSTTEKHGVLLRTRVSREAPALESVTGLYPGAAWHERETHEMFGVDFPGFAGASGLTPLLLAPEFEGQPLRKDFILAARVAKPWPGAKEPGESEHAASRRQPMRPPGVPDPAEWGPRASVD
jgi:NADH-quinone oxidoreductase subunit C